MNGSNQQGQGGQQQGQRFVRTAQVHISYLSKQLNLVVSEDFLRDIFSNFGEVLEVSLKKVCIDPVSFPVSLLYYEFSSNSIVLVNRKCVFKTVMVSFTSL